MDPVCWFLLTLITICLPVALVLFLAGLTCRDQGVSSQEDPLRSIRAIGLETRQEMDHISDDFVHRQVQRQLKKHSRTHHTRKRRT